MSRLRSGSGSNLGVTNKPFDIPKHVVWETFQRERPNRGAALAWLKKNVHPLDLVYRLAEDHSIVLLNGGGFHAPNWSVRVSFANLTDDVYDDIGRAVRAVGRSYVDAFNASKKGK
jgi:hypothetical protein